MYVADEGLARFSTRKYRRGKAFAENSAAPVELVARPASFNKAEPSRAEPRRAEPRRGERTHRYCTPTTKNKDERTMHLTNYSITKHDEARPRCPTSPLCTFAPLPLGLFPLSG